MMSINTSVFDFLLVIYGKYLAGSDIFLVHELNVYVTEEDLKQLVNLDIII